LDNKVLDKQSQHWESNFSSKPEMFGSLPSVAAIKAVKEFKKKGITNLIELGSGQGRDTIFFAQKGFKVKAIDYSYSAVKAINDKAKNLGLSKFISAKHHDVRKPLPFKDETFESCFSHMLYCMALTNNQLSILSGEILRVLKSKGLNFYTARHTGDGDYNNGLHLGEDLYESNGFIVHFFSKTKIRKLSKGFKILQINSFEEGNFPRKLYEVILEKKT
tara:strand:+ start:104 stop:760 length:657 start_codon:yes stop_codon:yes gene_type:complete